MVLSPKVRGRVVCNFLKREREGHIYGQPDIESLIYHCSSGSITVEMRQLLRGAAAVRSVASNAQCVVILTAVGVLMSFFSPQTPSVCSILPFLSTNDRSLVHTSERTLQPDITTHTHKGSHMQYLMTSVDLSVEKYGKNHNVVKYHSMKNNCFLFYYILKYKRN